MIRTAIAIMLAASPALAGIDPAASPSNLPVQRKELWERTDLPPCLELQRRVWFNPIYATAPDGSQIQIGAIPSRQRCGHGPHPDH